MAATLELQNAGLATLDLLDATVPKIQLTSYETGGWIPKIATPIKGRIPMPLQEILALNVKGATHNAVATLMQGLHDYQRLADEYIKDRTQEDPTWLHAQIASETGERRALVRRIVSEWQTQHYSPSAEGMGDLIGVQAVVKMVIEREPYWERTTGRSTTIAAQTGASISCDYTAGGTSHDIVGDVPARVWWLQLRPGPGDFLGRCWLGLRSVNKHGTAANFINVWELEDGTNEVSGDTADVVDATASGGDRVTVTPNILTWDDTWHEVLAITLGDVTVNYEENYGYFLELLRAKVGAGTWELQLRYGYSGMAAAEMIQGRIVELTNTSWDYLEMDQQHVPLRDIKAMPLGYPVEAYDASFEIEVWARRTVGADVLHLDCLCPVPLDEGWLKFWWDTDLVGDDGDYFAFGVDPKEGTQTLSVDVGATNIAGFIPYAHHNFRLPIGDGRLIAVYARAASSVLADTLGASPYYYERWLTLRGAE